LPRKFITLVLMLVSKFGMPSRVHAVELFAGCHSVTNGVVAYGYSAVPWPMFLCLHLVAILHTAGCKSPPCIADVVCGGDYLVSCPVDMLQHGF
jgi:hypothetical protein